VANDIKKENDEELMIIIPYIESRKRSLQLGHQRVFLALVDINKRQILISQQ
jgi:hypothetical protein